MVCKEIVTFSDTVKCEPWNNNLNYIEQQGYNWLRKNVNSKSICICRADKGGAVILLPPNVVTDSLQNKLSNTSNYEVIGTKNPCDKIVNRMYRLWENAVAEGFISQETAYEIIGLTAKGNKSSLDKYKPGIPFFYILAKIHKLSVDQLRFGVNLPVRTVTTLNNGPTVRPDKFIAYNFLHSLSIDYCKDLMKDGTQFLQHLQLVGASAKVDGSCWSFSVDVVSLYDSLDHGILHKAVLDAISTCRPEWPSEFKAFIMESINISLDGSFALFKGTWYIGKIGVATGGTLCVHIANIYVYYAYKNVIFVNIPRNILYVVRFVDDGTGLWKGNLAEFYIWFNKINYLLNKLYNIKLTKKIVKSYQFLEFLDVNFRFINGEPDTDLFWKPTDAHKYLDFNSCHPKHTFRSIVYSQGIRYRRIISDNNVLSVRLSQLKKFFINCKYPRKFVSDILDNVATMERNISYKNITNVSKPFHVQWVNTYGPGFYEVSKYVNRLNDNLKSCDVFKDFTEPIVKVVYRKGPCLETSFFKQKDLVIESESAGKVTTRCTPLGVPRRGRPCLCCELVSELQVLKLNNKVLYCAGGNCKSHCIIYCCHCSICKIGYFGKTVGSLHERFNGHASHINKPTDDKIDITDDNTLANHAKSVHSAKTRKDFNKIYEVFVVEYVNNPNNLLEREQSYVNRYKTFTPYGLNISNPAGVGGLLTI